MLDVELCDCFLEYGETTAEMALLFTFVLFGTSLIWRGLQIMDSHTVIFALLCFVVRPVVYWLSLVPTTIDRNSKVLIAWFGPRGLSSLLLILLPVFAGLPGSDRLFAICCFVVLISVVVHGGSLMLVRRKPKSSLEPEILPEKKGLKLPFSPATTEAVKDSERITVEEMIQLRQSGQPMVILDVRSDRTYDSSNLHAVGAIRVHPDRALEEVRRRSVDKDSWIIAFCA
jgi:NhaP-type Na+/H+ and K+/H+ antiporter